MPFAERTALIEKEVQEYRDKMLPFVTWWKSATHEQRLAVVKRWYDILLPHIRSGRVPAEDVARIADISSDGFLTAVLEPYWETSEQSSRVDSMSALGGCILIFREIV